MSKENGRVVDISDHINRDQDMKRDMDEIISHMLARRAMIDLKEVAEEKGWNVTNLTAIDETIDKHENLALEKMMRYHKTYTENPLPKINLADLGKEE